MGEAHSYAVVGPVCESGDFLGHDRELVLAEGDLLAICSAGAYGMSMSSNYNTRPRAAEVMVDGAASHLVREREPLPSLFQHERVYGRATIWINLEKNIGNCASCPCGARFFLFTIRARLKTRGNA